MGRMCWMWLWSSTQTYQRNGTLLWYERHSGGFRPRGKSADKAKSAICFFIHYFINHWLSAHKDHTMYWYTKNVIFLLLLFFNCFLSVTPFLKEYQNLQLSRRHPKLWSTGSPDYWKQLGRLTYLYHWHVLYFHYQVPSVRFISTASTLSSLMKIIMR